MKKRRGVAVAIDPSITEPVHPFFLPKRWIPTTDAHDTEWPTPCRFCGGGVRADEAVYDGPWRQHPACRFGQPWERARWALDATGWEMSEQDAVLVAHSARVEFYAEHALQVEPTWTVKQRRQRLKAWDHAKTAITQTVARLDQLRIDAGMVDVTCVSGPCCWCGRTWGRDWQDHGHRWKSGEGAPLCGDCATIYVRTGSPAPNYWDTQRDGIAEALTGVPIHLSEVPDGIHAWAEVADDAATPGPSEPWGFLPDGAVEQYRWTQWARHGGRHAPAEHRAEALDRARVSREVARAAHDATETERRAALDTYGFTKEA